MARKTDRLTAALAKRSTDELARRDRLSSWDVRFLVKTLRSVKGWDVDERESLIRSLRVTVELAERAAPTRVIPPAPRKSQ